MFQNIIDEVTEEQNEEIKQNNKRKINFKNLFSVSDIVLYVISFMVSMVGFSSEFAPFALSIFAAACSKRTPAGWFS